MSLVYFFLAHLFCGFFLRRVRCGTKRTERSPGLFQSSAPVLVGREREQSLLRDALDALGDGHGCVILIGGEAGIGKTALAAALGVAAADCGVRVLSGRCYDLTDTPPYGPWQEIFRSGVGASGPSALPGVLAHLDAAPEVRSQAALYAQTLELFRAMAAERPLLLVLDDIHWADAGSLDLLRVLARDLTDAPVIILATYQTDEMRAESHCARIIAVMVRERETLRLTLRPLDAGAVASLVRARYAEIAEADRDRLLNYLRAYAEGNPFYIGELLHGLEDDGRLVRADGWSVGDLADATVPLVLKQVIARRVARLGETAPRLLTIAAVIGQEVPLSLWATVAGVDGDTVLDLVEPAVGARILDESPDGMTVCFAHALIRETLYTGHLVARRREWHRRVAAALIARTSPEADADAIAYHLRQAGDPRAIEWLIRAGDRADQLFAHQTAVARFAHALALLGEDATRLVLRCELLLRLARLLRTTETRQSIGYAEEAAALASQAGDAVLEAVARFRLGQLLSYAGQRTRGLTTQSAAVAALDALPASAMERVAPLDFVAASSSARHGSVALRLSEVGRFADADRHIARALADGQVAPSLATHDVLLARAVVARSMGRPDEGWADVAAVYALNRATGDHDLAAWLIGNGVMWGALSYWTDDRAQLGNVRAMLREHVPQPGELFAALPLSVMLLPALYVEGAWAEARHIIAAARRTRFARHPIAQFMPIVTALIALGQGDTETARELVRDELPDGARTEPGSNRFPSATAFQRIAAALAIDAGDWDGARAWLDAHDRWIAWSGAVLGAAEADVLWAQFYHAAGDRPRSMERATDALAGATAPRQPLVLIAAHRLLGQIAGTSGALDDAETHFTAALTLADDCAAPYERARTLIARAELLAAAYDDDGTVCLDEMCALSISLGARPLLARLDVLDARRAPSIGPLRPRATDGMTDREMDVLRALAAGMSNREIAATFAISVRTAERHINNIYTKINVRGRSEAVAYAYRHGLTRSPPA